jgi:hypothetical protein
MQHETIAMHVEARELGEKILREVPELLIEAV